MLLELLEPQVIRDLLEHKAQQVQQDRKDQPDRKVFPVLLHSKEQQVLLD